MVNGGKPCAIQKAGLRDRPVIFQSARLTYCAAQKIAFKEAQMLTIFLSAWRSVAARFAEWRRRQQAYAELVALDDRSLADIGITRSEIPYILSHPRPERRTAKRKVVSSSLKHAA